MICKNCNGTGEVNVPSKKKYAVSDLENGLKCAFTDGPFNSYKEICDIGFEGEYIFRLVDGMIPMPIAKWVEDENRWVKIKSRK